MVDFDKRLLAAVALHLATLLYYACLLPKCYECARPMPHRLIINAARCGEIRRLRDHLLDVPIRVIRKGRSSFNQPSRQMRAELERSQDARNG